MRESLMKPLSLETKQIIVFILAFFLNCKCESMNIINIKFSTAFSWGSDPCRTIFLSLFPQQNEQRRFRSLQQNCHVLRHAAVLSPWQVTATCIFLSAPFLRRRRKEKWRTIVIFQQFEWLFVLFLLSLFVRV